MVFGSSYIVVTILLAAVYYQIFRLLEHPVIRLAFPQYVKHKAHYQKLAVASIVIYFIRSFFFMALGTYMVIVPNAFVKMELFIGITTLLEMPFLFYTYISHLRTFWSFEANQKKGINNQAKHESDEDEIAESSGRATRPDVIMVMALMDIDFIN